MGETKVHKFVLAVLALLLCGCATSLSQFQKSESSGSKKNKVALILIDNDGEKNTSNALVDQYIDSNDLLKKRINTECSPPPPQVQVNPAIVPLHPRQRQRTVGHLTEVRPVHLDRRGNPAQEPVALGDVVQEEWQGFEAVGLGENP